MAAAPGLPLLVAAAGPVGLRSVVVQILVPLAAELAPMPNAAASSAASCRGSCLASCCRVPWPDSWPPSPAFRQSGRVRPTGVPQFHPPELRNARTQITEAATEPAPQPLATGNEEGPPRRWPLICTFLGSPNGIRTRVSTLRGWCPRPLDDGAERSLSQTTPQHSGGGIPGSKPRM